ncbi:predicted protein, partial [Arabidopsis lyrata subsp. lyrata]
MSVNQAEEVQQIEKLYEFSERLNASGSLQFLSTRACIEFTHSLFLLRISVCLSLSKPHPVVDKKLIKMYHRLHCFSKVILFFLELQYIVSSWFECKEMRKIVKMIVSDTDHIDRLISCLQLALPFFARGAPSSRFLNYLNKHIIPVFDKEARQLLPSIMQLLKICMPASQKDWRGNELHIRGVFVVPNATNSLCGYKIVTCQPSDRLGEDFSELDKDFTE